MTKGSASQGDIFNSKLLLQGVCVSRVQYVLQVGGVVKEEVMGWGFVCALKGFISTDRLIAISFKFFFLVLGLLAKPGILETFGWGLSKTCPYQLVVSSSGNPGWNISNILDYSWCSIWPEVSVLGTSFFSTTEKESRKKLLVSELLPSFCALST